MLNKRIVVRSNDPINPRYVLSLKGKVLVDVALEPRRISFGELTRGETATRDFSVTVREDTNIRIKSVTVDHPQFRVAADEVPGSYAISFLGSSTIKRFRSSIKVAVEGGSVPEFSLSVSASVVGNLRFPRRIQFSRRGEIKPRNIDFTRRDAKRVKVKRVEDLDGIFSTEIQELPPPSPDEAVAAKGKGPASSPRQVPLRTRVIATLDVEKLNDVGRSEHRLRIHLDDPDEPVVEVVVIISELRPPRDAAKKTAPAMTFSTEKRRQRRPEPQSDDAKVQHPER